MILPLLLLRRKFLRWFHFLLAFFFSLNIKMKIRRMVARYGMKNLILYIFLFIVFVWILFYLFLSDSSIRIADDGKNLKEISNNWLKTYDNSNRNFIVDESKLLTSYSQQSEVLSYQLKIPRALDILPAFRENVNCNILFDPNHSNYKNASLKALKWTFIRSDYEFWQEFDETPNICKTLEETFSFFDKPLSNEEAEYPLAYGTLVYQDIRQMLYVLSAFYQPQNAYCIAIDDRASGAFKRQMHTFQSCFPNIHVYITRKIEYGGPQIPVVVLSCLQKLVERKHPWKYFQYLSGVDLPLKTNLEMVRIFKALNGTFNAEVTRLTPTRYPQKSSISKPPLPLWKSSLSATFSRESANAIVTNQAVYKLLLYLGYAPIPDETLWVTIAGNPDYIHIPGGFSASDFYTKILADLYNPKHDIHKVDTLQRYPLRSYYISRYQEWEEPTEKLGTQQKCSGKYSHYSCIFGVGDIPRLIVRPELVAHKFYLDSQPAAFFCLYENIRLRAMNYTDQETFDASYYSQLPQVQLSQGKSLNEVQFFF